MRGVAPAIMTPAMALSALGWFTVRLSGDVSFAQMQTETFTVLAICQWWNALNRRSDSRSSLDRRLLGNRRLLVVVRAATA
jgi:Ca2+-transporting ATPase